MGNAVSEHHEESAFAGGLNVPYVGQAFYYTRAAIAALKGENETACMSLVEASLQGYPGHSVEFRRVCKWKLNLLQFNFCSLIIIF